MAFEACDKRACKEVFLADDDLVEKTESFNVAVDDTPVLFLERVKTDQRQTGVINILDNDGVNLHIRVASISQIAEVGVYCLSFPQWLRYIWKIHPTVSTRAI